MPFAFAMKVHIRGSAVTSFTALSSIADSMVHFVCPVVGSTLGRPHTCER